MLANCAAEFTKYCGVYNATLAATKAALAVLYAATTLFDAVHAVALAVLARSKEAFA